MLKVISWYKIILNLLMEWLMESINEIDFMNEMTFKPPTAKDSKNNSILLFRMGRIDCFASFAEWGRPKGTVQWMKWIAVLAEREPAQPQLNSLSLPLSLLRTKSGVEWVVGLNWFVCFSFGSWNEFIGGLWAAAAARQLAKKEESAERKTNEINEAKNECELSLFFLPWAAVDEFMNQWSGEEKNKPIRPPQGAKSSAASQQQTKQFHNSWLELEKPKNCWICCLVAEGVVGLFVFSLLGVMGCGSSHSSAQRKTSKPKQPNWNSFYFKTFNLLLSSCLSFSLLFFCCGLGPASKRRKRVSVGGQRRMSELKEWIIDEINWVEWN